MAMSNERKQPGIGLFAACIVALPVLYCLSLGPVVWTWSRTLPNTPEWLDAAFNTYLVPANLLYDNAPQPLPKALDAYVELFISEK
ncbi:MAG: hypothetical protein ACM3U2_16700 [Deltaproteobacteria bacterium]